MCEIVRLALSLCETSLEEIREGTGSLWNRGPSGVGAEAGVGRGEVYVSPAL